MCIVIDTNTLSRVFDVANTEHDEYKPIYDWINYGKGKIVFGGTKYIQELGPNYVKLFNIYKSMRLAVSLPIDAVDAEEKVVASIIQHPNFDDQHIVSILRLSGCKLVCSDDSRAYPFFKHNKFFGSSSKKPKIYSGKRNSDLLCDDNIADICKPIQATTREQQVTLGIIRN